MKVLNRHDNETHINSRNIYVGRQSPWGNPYKIGVVYAVTNLDNRGWSRFKFEREDTIAYFRDYALKRLVREPDWLDPLRGAEALVCWCHPLPCHADVLIELLGEKT